MKTIQRELKKYVEDAEKMSGFDDAQNNEGDMSYFDDDSSFDDDGYGNASGPSGGAGLPLSDPYAIQYANTTAGDVTAILFGFNDYFNAAAPAGFNGVTNYGNPAAVIITNLATGTTSGYTRLISQSNNKNFKIGKWRFQSTTASQLQQTLQVNFVDANGNVTTKPMILSIMKDSYQQQTDQIDVTKTVVVDANTYITFTLKASATVVITMFPVAIISGKARLNGGAGMANLKAPRLSALNTAPVIIQTTSDVKSITK